MSLHLFPRSSIGSNSSITSPHANDDGISAADEQGSSDNDSTSMVLGLREDLKREKLEVTRLKKRIEELNNLLRERDAFQEEKDQLVQKCINETKALHRAKTRIKELEKTCEKKESDVAELTARLERETSSKKTLSSQVQYYHQEVSNLNFENSQLKLKVAQLMEDYRNVVENTPNSEQLVEELQQMRVKHTELKRKLGTMEFDCMNRNLIASCDEEDSPDRMIFDQYPTGQDGVNLQQELMMSGTFQSSTPIHGVTADVFLQGPISMNTSSSQTGKVPVFEASTQVEVALRMNSTQTDEIFANTTTPSGNSSVAQDPPSQNESSVHDSFRDASTQTSSLFGRSSCASETLENHLGADRAVQLYLRPTSTFGTSIINPQPPFPALGRVGQSSSHKFIWWIWFLAALCLILALIDEEGYINVTPIVNFVRGGVQIHHKMSPRPH